MTVHGAKGLEAPIVILADTTTPPAGLASAAAAAAAVGRRRRRRSSGPGARPTTSAPMAAARAAALDEAARRIPAAALCGDDARGRAADRLRRRRRSTSGRTAAGTTSSRGALEAAVRRRAGRRRRRRGAALPQEPDAAATRRSRRSRAAAELPLLPQWLTRNVAAEAPRRADHAVGLRRRPEAAEPLRPGDGAAARRSLRGNIVHRLMQSLPDIAAGARAPRPRAHYLARQTTDFSDGRTRRRSPRRCWRCSTTRASPRCSPPGSRAEVPIVGRVIGDAAPSSGQVDRLAVTPDAVLIADYKTNRPAPRSSPRRAATGYIAPARALPRRAAQALPGHGRPRRAGLDRRARSDGNSRPKPWMPRSTRPSPRRESALTLRGRVHRFRAFHGRAQSQFANNEVSHGRRQGFRRELRGRGAEGDRARSWSISGPSGAARAA